MGLVETARRFCLKQALSEIEPVFLDEEGFTPDCLLSPDLLGQGLEAGFKEVERQVAEAKKECKKSMDGYRVEAKDLLLPPLIMLKHYPRIDEGIFHGYRGVFNQHLVKQGYLAQAADFLAEGRLAAVVRGIVEQRIGKLRGIQAGLSQLKGSRWAQFMSETINDQEDRIRSQIEKELEFWEQVMESRDGRGLLEIERLVDGWANGWVTRDCLKPERVAVRLAHLHASEKRQEALNLWSLWEERHRQTEDSFLPRISTGELAEFLDLLLRIGEISGDNLEIVGIEDEDGIYSLGIEVIGGFDINSLLEKWEQDMIWALLEGDPFPADWKRKVDIIAYFLKICPGIKEEYKSSCLDGNLKQPFCQWLFDRPLVWLANWGIDPESLGLSGRSLIFSQGESQTPPKQEAEFSEGEEAAALFCSLVNVRVYPYDHKGGLAGSELAGTHFDASWENAQAFSSPAEFMEVIEGYKRGFSRIRPEAIWNKLLDLLKSLELTDLVGLSQARAREELFRRLDRSKVKGAFREYMEVPEEILVVKIQIGKLRVLIFVDSEKSASGEQKQLRALVQVVSSSNIHYKGKGSKSRRIRSPRVRGSRSLDR